MGVTSQLPLSAVVPQLLTEGSAPYRIVGVNEPWLKMCGFTYEECVGKTAKIM